MLTLDRLPLELIVPIFSQLDNINDALHLGRTCRTLAAVLANEHMFMDVMRSIIVRSVSTYWQCSP